jgi:hypothetical protein
MKILSTFEAKISKGGGRFFYGKKYFEKVELMDNFPKYSRMMGTRNGSLRSPKYLV